MVRIQAQFYCTFFDIVYFTERAYNIVQSRLYNSVSSIFAPSVSFYIGLHVLHESIKSSSFIVLISLSSYFVLLSVLLPPFLSIFGSKYKFRSPPNISLSLWLTIRGRISSKALICSCALVFVGAQYFRKAISVWLLFQIVMVIMLLR